jgi:hypothetical protein
MAERVLICTTRLVDRVAPPGMIADVNESTLSAVDAVRSYVVALREVRSRLFADLPGMTGVQDVMFAVRSQRTMAREGRTASGIEYSVVGCDELRVVKQGRWFALPPSD